MSAQEARQLLKDALRKVPPGTPRQPGSAPRKPLKRKVTTRVAAGRGEERAELSDLLYWKK